MLKCPVCNSSKVTKSNMGMQCKKCNYTWKRSIKNEL